MPMVRGGVSVVGCGRGLAAACVRDAAQDLPHLRARQPPVHVLVRRRHDLVRLRRRPLRAEEDCDASAELAAVDEAVAVLVEERVHHVPQQLLPVVRPLEGLHHAEVLVERHAAVAVDVGLAHEQLGGLVARDRVAQARQHLLVHARAKVPRGDVALAGLVHGEEVGLGVLDGEREEDGVEHAVDERELREAVADGGVLLDGGGGVRGEAREAVLVDVGQADGLEQAARVGHEHLVLHGHLEEVEEVQRREEAVLAQERRQEVVLQLALDLLDGVAFDQSHQHPKTEEDDRFPKKTLEPEFCKHKSEGSRNKFKLVRDDSIQLPVPEGSNPTTNNAPFDACTE
mmetsp:Transcript_59278/g.123836  ORF Transcript_59278/g.123836 Transcript_59278/m.123836 type:complete len:343 (+) Transcript_59278:83-1111(+)